MPYFSGLRIAQLFAKAYNKETAQTDLGIPIKRSIDFQEKTKRLSIEDSYAWIIDDLKTAIPLLSALTPIKTHPSKAACYGSLARIYLFMQDYKNAGLYADSCLQVYNLLMDYNSIDTTAAIPFTRFNDEVIFQATSFASQPLAPRVCKIDTVLFNSYAINDLRRSVYFQTNGDGSHAFKGDYDGTANNGNGRSFTGIVTDEQYLIKAECLARLNKTEAAIRTINTLLEKRWKKKQIYAFSIERFSNLVVVYSNGAAQRIIIQSFAFFRFKKAKSGRG